jgi:hypothetical protein
MGWTSPVGSSYGATKFGSGWVYHYETIQANNTSGTSQIIPGLIITDTGNIGAWSPSTIASPYPFSPLTNNTTSLITRAADVLYIPATLVARTYVPFTIYFYPRYSNTQLALATGQKNYIVYFANTSGAYGIYLDPDGKVHIDGNATTSGALTWSANQRLGFTVNRPGGAVTLSGFTTGNSTVSGLTMGTTAGNVYIGSDSAGANQGDGLFSLLE